MIKRISTWLILGCLGLVSSLTNATAQSVDVQIEAGASFLKNKKIRSDFPVGFQGGLTIKKGLPYSRLNWTAHMDLNWYFQPLDEVYTEHVVYARLSPGLEYDLVSYRMFRIAPFYKVGPSYLSNYDREGGVVGEDETAPIGARYLRGWGVAQEVGLKGYIGEFAFIKVQYMHSRPTLRVLNHEMQGNLGNGFENSAKISRDMGFWGFTLGVQIPRN
jgi:hypothetical protein